MEMKIAAAKALSGIVRNELKIDYIIPKPFNPKVLPAVATSVAIAAVSSGVSPEDTDIDWIEYKAKNILRK